MIDEWQVEPAIWNHVRRTVDDRGAPGQFILTNWAVRADDVTSDPGTEFRAGLRIVPKDSRRRRRAPILVVGARGYRAHKIRMLSELERDAV